MAVYAVPSVTTVGGTQLIAANGSRKRLIIENSDANRLHCRVGGGAVSATSYSFSLAQYENMTLNDCTAEITGIWSADGAGSAHITEY